MEFVPLWTDILDAPCWKIMDLSPELYRFWTFCLLAAQKHDFADGHLPDDRTLGHWFQMSVTSVGQLRDRLVTHALLDRDDTCDGPEFKVHDWDQWRLVRDPGAKERKRRQRSKNKGISEESRGGHGAVTATSRDVTPQQTTDNKQQTTISRQNAPAIDASHAPVIALALERWGASSGDSTVLDLLRDYPPDLVRAAMDRHWDAVGQAIKPALLRGVCRGMLEDGWPPKVKPRAKNVNGEVQYKSKIVPASPLPSQSIPKTPKISAGEALAILKGAAK